MLPKEDFFYKSNPMFKTPVIKPIVLNPFVPDKNIPVLDKQQTLLDDLKKKVYESPSSVSPVITKDKYTQGLNADSEAMRRKRLLSLRLGLMSTIKTNKFNPQTLPGNTLLGGK